MPAARPTRPDTSVRSLSERDALVTANLGICYAVAQELYRASPLCRRLGDVDDLISVAKIGLIRAAELFRPNHQSGAKFSTYAYKRIRLYILDQARDTGLIRIPEAVATVLLHGRAGAIKQEHLQAGRAAWRCRLFTADIDQTVARDPPSPAEQLLPEVLAQLSPTDRQLLDERFGLNGAQPRTLKQMAEPEHISFQAMDERVRAACRRLRVRLSEALDADYEQSRRAA